MLEDFLPLVTKPARYINNEIHSVHKDLASVRTKVCLFFPDTYEVGMSHLGLRILYQVLNSRDDTACERVFSPWTDYEEKLRASGRPLTSLESNLPLAEFDIIGVTLQYELSYSNILVGLELGRVPVRSSDRSDDHPIVIAGGPCAVNPMPLSAFIDAFFIGEAEEAMHEIVELRQKHPGRKEFLAALAGCDGFYVPALGAKSVKRRVIRDLESAVWPSRPLIPLLKPVHDRVTVEVARGCIRGCRFCQAGIIYRPYRERSPERVKNLLQESIACTGFDELSLASLSTGDYSAIQPLMEDLVERYRASRVSISLPSLRIGTLTPEMIRAVAGVRKSGFTLAPEAGTERLRCVINKPLAEQELLDAAAVIFSSGWSVLKLYFMIGMPTETDEDLDGIIRLVNNLFAVGKRESRRHIQINVSVSTFVPKPHTPFQWFGQATREEIKAKQAYLDRGLRKKGIALKPHHAETSVLEGAFARGDAAIGKVIEEAVRLGCRFDGWTECFDFKKWTEAFRICGLDPAAYASRDFGLDETLPWQFVQTGVTQEFLKREYNRAITGETTPNCRTKCEACGMACKDGGRETFGKPASPISALTTPLAKPAAPSGETLVTKIRMRYSKTGRLRFLSHLDLMTLVQRASVRAHIPLAFSQGFNPHPKIAFGPALPVGMESETEYLDMETDAGIDLLATAKSLNSTLPQGMRILEMRVVPRKSASLSGSIERYTYAVEVPAGYAGGLEERVQEFLSKTSIIVEKDGKQKDIRPCIETVTVSLSEGPALLSIALQDQGQIKPRIQDVMEQLLSVSKEQFLLFRVKRTGLYCNENGQWRDPMDV
jgi:radical SAM-linked protein